MNNRDDLRSELGLYFASLPEWIREPFAPIREVIALLLDKERDDLAREVVASVGIPENLLEGQAEEFITAKGGILSKLDALITYTTSQDYFNSPEVKAFLKEAERRREIQ